MCELKHFLQNFKRYVCMCVCVCVYMSTLLHMQYSLRINLRSLHFKHQKQNDISKFLVIKWNVIYRWKRHLDPNILLFSLYAPIINQEQMPWWMVNLATLEDLVCVTVYQQILPGRSRSKWLDLLMSSLTENVCSLMNAWRLNAQKSSGRAHPS